MVINEKWVATFAVNNTYERRLAAIYNVEYDHEPSFQELTKEIGDRMDELNNQYNGIVFTVAVIGWQRMRVVEERV